MKLLNDWGFTPEGWRNNQHGEYWVFAQGILLIGFVFLPVYRLDGLNFKLADWLYLSWGFASVLALFASILVLKGLLDLGRNLTPLPYPKEDGQLVQSGVYSIVRHPLYSGLVLAALSWTIFQISLSHLIGVAVLFAFFNAKANREEVWLSEKYPDYSEYRQRTKKLIPWLY
jgi:protein-S-isoprenylcysteine O-methyltransferase Ste14